jgi:hypothetical protein
VPFDTAQKVLRLYGQCCRGYNVLHFHDKLQSGRRPLPGKMLFVDGISHAWFPAVAPARQDLVAFMDDANNRVCNAWLVEEEGTRTVMAGLREVLEKRGIFCSFCTDQGGHFFHTPKAGGRNNNKQRKAVISTCYDTDCNTA